MRQESNSIEAYGLIEAVHDIDTDTGIFTEFNIIRKNSKKVKYDRYILGLECSCGLPNEFYGSLFRTCKKNIF